LFPNSISCGARSAARRLGTTIEFPKGMKSSLSLLGGLSFGLSLLGCATVPPPVSPETTKVFQDVIREAEAAGAAAEPPDAVVYLREAKSAFAYAQHLPGDPDHARRVLMRAQADAELALALAQFEAQKRSGTTTISRRELTASAATP
jgi:Domain of unknown function (DUF4398)